METIEGQTFKDTRVDMDGKQFVNCVLDHCLLRYNGGEYFGVPAASDIIGCSFVFDGAAQRTLHLLRLLYRSKHAFLQAFAQYAVDYIVNDDVPESWPTT